MLNPGRFRPTCAAAATTAGDTHVPLSDLSAVGARIDAVQKFLQEKVNNNTVISSDQMQMVSTEISSAINNIIICGTALIACSQPRNPSFSQLCFSDEKKVIDLKLEVKEEEINGDWEIIELDAVELLAEHIHFCEICGKGFKRDANLRMHMRAHGDGFKTHEALIKPENFSKSPHQTRFSCPFSGCNRNKNHNKFRPLKSVICVKNHFKRSHCPKMYSCNRCHKKNFAVLTDLKSHLKHCGDSKWKCSCGTSFSRKDKLFGHMALFEGHMPAVIDEDDDKGKIVISVADDNKESGQFVDDGPDENGFFDEFGSIEEFGIQDFLDSPNGPSNWIL